MSKGHGAAGLYATLALRGFFPRERLDEFCVDGGSLYGHVTHRGVPGVDVSTGALGHGLAVAVGRSEEHTSELQSRLHLVCRLLLEKKKNKQSNMMIMHDNTSVAK